MTSADKRMFDVALSFAGEQREYVDKVNAELQRLGISVYYDKSYEVSTWGQNLVDHFSDIFKERAKFCVMFISEAYVRKVWTNFERQVAESRDLIDSGYILPVKFDDSDVQGLLSTKAYLKANEHTPAQLAAKIAEKINPANLPEPNRKPPTITYKQVSLKPRHYNPYREREAWIDKVLTELDSRDIGDDRVDITPIRVGKLGLRVVFNGKSVWSVDFNFGGMGDDKGMSISASTHDWNLSNNSVSAFGTFDWSREKKDTVFIMHDLSFLSLSFGGGEKSYTADEFADELWEKIITLIQEADK